MYRQSKELKQKRSEKKMKKFIFFYFFPTFVILILFIFLFNSKELSIKEVNLTFDNKKPTYLDKEEVLNEVDKVLSGMFFSILSKNNYIFFPRNELERRLKNKFSTIKSIDFSWDNFFKDIKINIVEEKPYFLYCRTINKKDCYFTNQKGKIFYKHFLKLENNQENNFLILISDHSLSEGDVFFNSIDEENKVTSLIQNLKKYKNLNIEYFIKKNKYFSIFILNGGTKILLNSDFDKEKIFLKLSKILNQDDFKIEDGKFKKKIAYINLTLNNKIPYCLKGEECEENY